MHWSKLEPFFEAARLSASALRDRDRVSMMAYRHTTEKAMAKLLEDANWSERHHLAKLREDVLELVVDDLARFREGYKAGTGGESAAHSDQPYLSGYIHGFHWWRYVR